MKKFLFALTAVSLLAGCSAQEAEPVNEVPEEVEEPAAKVKAPQPFYIAEAVMGVGMYVLEADPVEWLSEAEGTCLNYSEVTEDSDMAVCNPNGFLIVNESSDDRVEYIIPHEALVYANIVSSHSETKTLEGTKIVTFEELIQSFKDNPDFFAVTPFELEYGTLTVNGQEMSDQITALKEIYIP